jgi:probable F420-dependent oxidoreductase
MKFGIQYALGDPKWTPGILAPGVVKSFAKSAEDGGFDAIAFTDHPAPSALWVERDGEGVADPFTSLGFVAAVTERVRLMTFVLVPSYRNPIMAAQQVSTLDQLSAGRVTVAMGTGYMFGEFKALDVDPTKRRELFDRNVGIMREAWTNGEVSIETNGVIAKPTRMLPSVVQRPHPPLWIHGNAPFGTARAGAYGDGWLGMITGEREQITKTIRTKPIEDLDVLARRIDEVRMAAESAGRKASDVEIVVMGLWPMIDVRKGRPADQYLEEIAALEALGVDWTISLSCGDDTGAAVETVEWFARDIIGPSRN